MRTPPTAIARLFAPPPSPPLPAFPLLDLLVRPFRKRSQLKMASKLWGYGHWDDLTRELAFSYFGLLKAMK